jgi:hypothetical protein
MDSLFIGTRTSNTSSWTSSGKVPASFTFLWRVDTQRVWVWFRTPCKTSEGNEPKGTIEGIAPLHFDVRASLAVEAFAPDGNQACLVWRSPCPAPVWMQKAVGSGTSLNLLNLIVGAPEALRSDCAQWLPCQLATGFLLDAFLDLSSVRIGATILGCPRYFK